MSQKTYKPPLPSSELTLEPPFPKSEQLCPDLSYNAQARSFHRLNHNSPTGTCNKLDRLPGIPRILLHQHSTVLACFHAELATPAQDALAKHFLTSRDTVSIALSEQRLYGRSICLSEDPALHLVWEDDKMFVKPLPLVLLSHAFWTCVSSTETFRHPEVDAHVVEGDVDRSIILKGAYSLLHTYALLLQHESDFHLAQQHHLIPRGAPITFDSLTALLSHFSAPHPALLTRRYRKGHYTLQLQTLNALSLLTRLRFYRRTHQHRYNAFFVKYYGPTLFVFATFSVTLNAMQVALAVRAAEAPVEGTVEGGLAHGWRYMGYAFRFFAIYAVTFATSHGAVLLLILYVLIVCDIWDGLLGWIRARRWRHGSI